MLNTATVQRRLLSRISAGGIALATALLLATAAPASAGAPPTPPTDCTTTPTYDHMIPSPSVISVSSKGHDGDVVIGAIGDDLAVRTFTADFGESPVPLSPLTCLGGTALGYPSVVGVGSYTQMFVVGADSSVHYKEQFSGRNWSAWRKVPSSRVGLGVTAIITGIRRTDIFYPDSYTGQIMHQRMVNGQWSRAENLGGLTVLPPSVTRGADNRLHVWMIGNDDHAYFRSGNTGAWSGWQRLPGTATFSHLSVTTGFDNDRRREDLFAVSSHGTVLNGEVYHATVTDLAAFSGWQKMSELTLRSNVDSDLSAVAPEAGSLVVLMSTNNVNYLERYRQGAWQSVEVPPYMDPWCMPAPGPGQYCSFVTAPTADSTPRLRPLVRDGHQPPVAHRSIHR